MGNINTDAYFGHKKYVKIIIKPEMKQLLSELLDSIIYDLNIKETPEVTITDGPSKTSITVEWMFSGIVCRKWINIELTISARLRKLRQKNKIIAFNITWV